MVVVAQVSHRLHDPTWAELGISLPLFGAIWLCWMSFTLYANIRADQTRTRVVLLAMTGIAVMAAAVQEADGEQHLAERLGLFVIIVLGEAVYRLVSVAGGVEWTGDLLWVTGGGFVIVGGLWWLTFEYGFSVAPHARLGRAVGGPAGRAGNCSRRRSRWPSSGFWSRWWAGRWSTPR